MAALSLGLKRETIGVAGHAARAKRRLPAMAWAYLEGGAEDQVTLAANRAGFHQWRLVPRILSGTRQPRLSTRVAGDEIALPVALAPVGITGLIRWDGDRAAARAAERAGTRLALSTGSSWSLEEIADATDANHWFQLYPYGNRDKVGALVDRAAAAGYSALFLTVDVGARGNREVERRAGMQMPLRLTPRSLIDFACHPRWAIDALRRNRIAMIHYAQASATGISAAVGAVAEMDRHMQGDLDWDDLAWLRDRWKGPLYVKGVLHPDDAVRAVHAIGCDGVAVSNHGGRQLDRAPAAIEALPGIVDALRGRGEVFLDGGVRRGADAIIALALGANAVMVGRPYCYGMASDGEAGVIDILRILRDDIQRTLVLMGCPGVDALDRSWIERAPRD
jgi:isopentenyl diphosphate isomerase/L-lactate dehydrogenase-like FMN-dependent dehydrogenase